MHSSMYFTYVLTIHCFIEVFIYYLTKSDMLRRILKTNQDLFQFYVIILTFLLYERYIFNYHYNSDSDKVTRILYYVNWDVSNTE